jgi:hypothetical protein
MNSIYRIIITLLFSSIVACTYNPPADTSVTAGNEDEDIGIGGTGKQLASESGIGGTGKQPVGILGTITGFGSIFVNGIEIEYDENTPFSIDGKSSPLQQLAIGDVVEVLTTDGNDFTHAKAINLRHEVIGKVESLQPETFSFSINGQSIIQPINNVWMPAIGTWVAVSGHRVDEQNIIATRITPATPEQALLRSSMTLPFKGKTSRWLVQVYAPGDSVHFQLEGDSHMLQLDRKDDNDNRHRLGIKVLELHKAKSGRLEVDQVTDPVTLPRGRQTSLPENTTGKEAIPGAGFDPYPGASTGANQGTLPGNYMPGANQSGPAASGTVLPRPAQVINPGSVQNYRR